MKGALHLSDPRSQTRLDLINGKPPQSALVRINVSRGGKRTLTSRTFPRFFFFRSRREVNILKHLFINRVMDFAKVAYMLHESHPGSSRVSHLN